LSAERGGIELAKGEYDIVLANILAQPLKDLAGDIIARVRSGGCLVLSGLLAMQAQGVAAAYTRLGMPEPERLDMGEWAALLWR